MEQIFSSSISPLSHNGDYLERPRLHRLLKTAMDYPLVVVCAGSGYGKTRTVYSFLQEYGAHTAWLQISERDNIGSRFWENYIRMVSLYWPETGARLSTIGFPQTDEAFTKYVAMLREAAALPEKQIRVFDDLHLLHNPEVLRFFERVTSTLPANMTVVLISRTTPDINLIGMMMRERVFTIQEDTLCFTEDEIAEYLCQLKLPVTRREIRNIYDDTQGWAFAINLIGRSLAKEQKYERYALEAMKKNIFRLIEAEISPSVSAPLWRFLLRISLIDHLAASLIKLLAKDDALVKEMELLNAYIRYDFNLDTYLIHHLFLDYLRQKQDQLLTDEERSGTYQTAGAWCEANGYHMDALSYYEKAGDYYAITQNIAALSELIPPDMARYALEILDRAPDGVAYQDTIFQPMYLKLKISLGQLDEAAVLAERCAADYEARPASPPRNRALTALYGNWAFLRLINCTNSGEYDFDLYYQKMSEYYDKSPFAVISSYSAVPVIAWASLVGTSCAGAQEQYVQAVARMIPHVSRLRQGLGSGFDQLVRGELCYYRGQFAGAEQYLRQAVEQARACDQYITQNRALVYLMQIAFGRGDFISARQFLREMAALLSDKDYGIRHTMYDIAHGFYHLALGQPELTPEWLKGDFSPYAHPSFLENYANRLKAQSHYQTGQYSVLLAFIENEMARQTILFGRIELKILAALSLYQLKRRAEAIAALTEAYDLAEPNNIIAPFTQYAKDMRTLTAAALKEHACPIPREWLANVNRKSSANAKRRAKMIAEYRAVNHIETGVNLTGREIEILKDLSQGLSRTEIAASRNNSVSTVKMAINIIYDKLCVNSLPDAIRVAVDLKII